jgi:hypothetical protein
MSTSPCATEPGLVDSQAGLVPGLSEGASRRPRGVLIGFAATVTIGLGLAIWYVSVRIVDAHETVPVSTVVVTPARLSTSQSAPPLQAAPAAPEVASATPPPPLPDVYLQVAGLGPRQDTNFVKGLEAKGYRVRVVTESASSEEDNRILIGPFVGQSALKKAERRLQSAGVLAIETAH